MFGRPFRSARDRPARTNHQPPVSSRKSNSLPGPAPHAPGASAESPQMATARCFREAVVGFGDGGQSADRRRRWRAYPDDAELNLGSHSRQSERPADGPLRVAAGGVDGVYRSANTRADEFFDRRFAAAARYGDDGMPTRVGAHGPSPATPAT